MLCSNYNHRLCSKMNKCVLTECIELPGFYHVPNFDTYVVNVDGVFFNLKTKKYITVNVKNSRYNRIEFCVDGKMFNKTVHRILAFMFIPKPKHLENIPYEKLEINHIDNNPRNNSLSNLEWCTRSENIRHSILKGNAICTPVLARDVHTDIIRRFDIVQDCIDFFNIPKDKLFKHLKSRYIGTLTKDFHVFKYDDNIPWPKLQKHQIVQNSLLYEQRGHWLGLNINKKLILANTLKDLCDLIGLNYWTTLNVIKAQGGRSDEGNKVKDWLIQYKCTTPPEILCLLPDKKIKNNKPKPLKLINTLTNEEIVFENYSEICKHLNIAKDKLARTLFLGNGKYLHFKIEHVV